MIARIVLFGWTFALIGCGGEPERSRVVPASATGRNGGEASHKLAPGDIQKIEMH
jgi:hypothetical protein